MMGKVSRGLREPTAADLTHVTLPALVRPGLWWAATRRWLSRPDVRVALATTIGLRVFCSMVATALPLLLPSMYPWQSPAQWVPHDMAAASGATTPGQPAYSVADYLVRPWERWDSLWYEDIARYGYLTRGTSAFLPLYPALMRLFAPLTGGDVVAAGLLISTIAAFVAFLGLYRLAQRLTRRPDVAAYSVMVATLLPTSFFLMAAYTESLFLALTLWAMLAALDGRWWRVAILGGLAALVRQQGVLIAALALPAAWSWVRWVWEWAGSLKAPRREASTPAAVPNWRPLVALIAPALTYGTWAAALRVVVHAPLPWQAVVGGQGWNLHLTWPWSGLLADLYSLIVHPPVGLAGVLQSSALDLAASCAAAVLLIVSWRRLPAGIALFCAAIWLSSVVKVLPSGLAVSEGRYMLQMLPLCIVPASWLARGRAWRRIAWVACGMICMALYLWIFVLWGWVD